MQGATSPPFPVLCFLPSYYTSVLVICRYLFLVLFLLLGELTVRSALNNYRNSISVPSFACYLKKYVVTYPKTVQSLAFLWVDIKTKRILWTRYTVGNGFLTGAQYLFKSFNLFVFCLLACLFAVIHNNMFLQKRIVMIELYKMIVSQTGLFGPAVWSSNKTVQNTHLSSHFAVVE